MTAKEKTASDRGRPGTAGGAGRERCKCAMPMWEEQIKQERSRQNMRRRGCAGLVLAAAVLAAAGTGNMTALAGQAAASGPALESRAEGLGEEKQTKQERRFWLSICRKGLT